MSTDQPRLEFKCCFCGDQSPSLDGLKTHSAVCMQHPLMKAITPGVIEIAMRDGFSKLFVNLQKHLPDNFLISVELTNAVLRMQLFNEEYEDQGIEEPTQPGTAEFDFIGDLIRYLNAARDIDEKPLIPPNAIA